MNILFLPAYHYPEKAASLYLGENSRDAYAERGWKMKMYCPVPTRGVDAETRKKYKRSPDSVEAGGALMVHRFSLWREGRSPVLRLLRYMICQHKQYRYAKKEKNTDVLFVSSTPPTQGLLMARVKRALKCKTVYNLQDMFPESLVTAGITHKGSLLYRIGRRIEDYTYKNADKIVVISERFKKDLISKGVPEDKISVVRNWVDEEAVVPVERANNPLFDRYGLPRDKFYVTYCGNLGKSQNIDVLCETAKLLEKYTEIAFVVVGDGVCRGVLEDKILKMGLKNITMLPFMPYSEIGYVFSMGDVGLVISKSGTGNNSVPSKTWSIMSAGRAVLASFDSDSELFDIIKEADCGVCVMPDDASALQRAILKLYGDIALCKHMGDNARQFVLDELTKKKGCEALISIIENC